MTERILVIGGDAGGMAAISQVRNRRPDVEIVVLERSDWTSYSACGIPYAVGGEVDPIERLQARTPQQFRDRHRVDVRMRHEAMAIDLDGRFVEVRAHESERTYRLSFDQILIGTGGSPVRPDLPGIDRALRAHTLDDAHRLLAELSGDPRTAVVVGGGFIGIEMAEAFVHRGLRTTLVDSGAQLIRAFDPDMAARIEHTLRDNGVNVVLGARVSAIDPDSVVTAAGRLPSDLVVLGVGTVPNSALAADAGLELGVHGSVVVDRRQQTSAAGVFAAGDCAQSMHLVSGRPVHLPLGTVANKQSRVAGINLGGGYATFPGVLGTAIVKVFNREVARTGLSESEAAAAGFGAVSTTIESTTRAGYYPGAEPMAVKVIAERATGRLLGFQIFGGVGAAKRIDSCAVALTAGFDAETLLQTDLAYAPPFSPAWDPVQVACREVLKLL
jgi:NADPH-dependent 2,4-dienoyl-CoA reductase/sulfur reductase-like enzyme